VEDNQIIGMFWERNEGAIRETEQKYGPYCLAIARRITSSPYDAEECVNDTYLRAWNAIPPERPNSLKLFLGRITRNLAINRYEADHAAKRNGGFAEIADEFLTCVPDREPLPGEDLAFRDALNRFLSTLSPTARILFLRRYWYFLSIREIARGMDMTEGSVRVSLHRTRALFRTYLTKEGLI